MSPDRAPHAYRVGIDIGSTATKIVVMHQEHVVEHLMIPTGWNAKETADAVQRHLAQAGYAQSMDCVATGYGRACVTYANRAVTEITCHGAGAWELFKRPCTVVDIGGQDTKVVIVNDGQVVDFVMNDKCAAGTGKFVEIMAARLGTDLEEFYTLASQGTPLSISAICAVFAESEVISLIGEGKPREDIAAGVVASVTTKVANLVARQKTAGDVVLTGGLSQNAHFLASLSQRLGRPVATHELAPYAGALGAAVLAGRSSHR